MNRASIKDKLEALFIVWEKIYGIENPLETFGSRFAVLIRRAFEITGEKVVILVDEYDNPLINTLDNPVRHSNHRDILKSIYANLKSLDSSFSSEC